MIVGTGYNGMPRGCHDDEMPWNKGTIDPLESKYLYVVHAELNAVVNRGALKEGCTMYVTLFPCAECAKVVIQASFLDRFFRIHFRSESNVSFIYTKSHPKSMSIRRLPNLCSRRRESYLSRFLFIR